MKLFYYRDSSASRRVRIALALKRIAYEAVEVDLAADAHHDAWYAGVNSQQLVPVLETDDGTILTQSEAIVARLDALADDTPLLGRHAAERAAILEIVNIIGCDVHALQGLRLSNWLRDAGAQPHVFPGIARRAVENGLAACERILIRNAVSRFSFSNTPCSADIWLVPQLANARRHRVEVSRFSRIMQIERECLMLDEFRTVMGDTANEPPG